MLNVTFKNSFKRNIKSNELALRQSQNILEYSSLECAIRDAIESWSIQGARHT
jgi:hypothetical protein